MDTMAVLDEDIAEPGFPEHLSAIDKALARSNRLWYLRFVWSENQTEMAADTTRRRVVSEGRCPESPDVRKGAGEILPQARDAKIRCYFCANPERR